MAIGIICFLCEDKAIHFPFEGWDANGDGYCCHCYTGSINCQICKENKKWNDEPPNFEAAIKRNSNTTNAKFGVKPPANEA